jgi:DNA-binding CsgD family transcriptional regulator
MQFQYIHEVLRLLLQQCHSDPGIFISFFNKSESLIGFNYCSQKKKFTHISDSFYSILGYKSRKMLKNDDFIVNIIHPQDKAIFIDYFFSEPDFSKEANLLTPLRVSKLKCRVRHIKGYWKYFIFFSMSYFENTAACMNKIGLIADEYFHPNYQAITKNIDGFDWGDITQKKSAFMYKSLSINISQRESEILEMIGEGQIAKEIASKLNISPNTVITHRKNLISKFNVRNTAQLIKKASQMMLI